MERLGPNHNARLEQAIATLTKKSVRLHLLFTISYRTGKLLESNLQTCFFLLDDQSDFSTPVKVMVELIGIEPMTPCLQSRCSPS